MPATYPQINGVRADWSSITLTVKGKNILGAKSINYSDKLEPTKVKGTHPQPLARTRGMYEAEASIELYLQEADDLCAALGDGYMEVDFIITCSYSEGSGPVKTDVLQGVRIKGRDHGYSEGSDPLSVKFDLDVLAIKWNNRRPVKNALY